MWAKRRSEILKGNESLHWNDFLELQKWLTELKSELHLKTNIDKTNDHILQHLSKSIATLLKYEGAWKEAELDNYPELIELMRQTFHEFGDWNQYSYNISGEKKLLLVLINNVLAWIWRRKQERLVVWYIEEAVKFFSSLRLGWVYSFLLEKAT